MNASLPPKDPAVAAEVSRLPHDPQAKRSYDGFCGGFLWGDEWSPGLQEACTREGGRVYHLFREAVAHRASLIRGEPSEEFAPSWAHLQAHYPDWPGFHPERSSPALRAALDTAAQAFFDSLEQSGL